MSPFSPVDIRIASVGESTTELSGNALIDLGVSLKCHQRAQARVRRAEISRDRFVRGMFAARTPTTSPLSAGTREVVLITVVG